MSYTTKQFIELAGLSERALRHYDEIGLLSPERDSKNQYRIYSDEDLKQAHIIQLMTEVGYSLEEVKQQLHSPYFSLETFLEDAVNTVQERKKEFDTLLSKVQEYSKKSDTLQKSITAHTNAGMDESTAQQYATEVFLRWGRSDAYAESQKRTAGYTTADWKRVKEEMGQHIRELAHVMDSGPDSLEAQKVTDSYRTCLSQFYDVTPDIFSALAEMYIADPRFAKTFNSVRPGLAQFVKEAIDCYVSRMK